MNNNSSHVFKSITILFILFSALVLSSQSAYIPEPTGKVISDFQNLLSESEKENLAKSIKENYLSNSNQLIIVSIPTKFLGDLTIEDYSNQLFKKWKPGQKDLNNGVLFIIAGSKTDSVNRKVRIEVGYGLEGALPDLLTQRILKQLVVPKLKQYNYVEAIQLGATSIINAIKTENVGHKPLFKLKTNSSDVLTDKAGILSVDEFTTIKNKIENSSFNKTKSFIEITEETPSSNDGYNFIEFYPNDNFNLSNALFEIYVTPNISIDTLGIIKRNQPNYSIKIFKHSHLSDNDKKNYEAKIKTHLTKNELVDTINTVIELSNKDLTNKWITALFIMLLLCLPFIISATIYYLTRHQRLQPFNKVLKYHYFLYSFFAGLMLFVSAALILVNLLLNFGLYYDSYELSLIYLIPLFIFHTIILIFGVVFTSRLIKYYLPSFFTDTSSDSDGSYDSTYSSSDNSSSSDSSNSSSSNDDYSGGGGDSGGGGSSSDW